MTDTNPIPSEGEVLRAQAESMRSLTPTQRLHMVVEMNRLIDAELSKFPQVREALLRYQQNQEDEWQRIMKDFFVRHVSMSCEV